MCLWLMGKSIGPVGKWFQGNCENLTSTFYSDIPMISGMIDAKMGNHLDVSIIMGNMDIPSSVMISEMVFVGKSIGNPYHW